MLTTLRGLVQGIACGVCIIGVGQIKLLELLVVELEQARLEGLVGMGQIGFD